MKEYYFILRGHAWYQKQCIVGYHYIFGFLLDGPAPGGSKVRFGIEKEGLVTSWQECSQSAVL